MSDDLNVYTERGAATIRRCTNEIEHSDFTATRCIGFVVFRPEDVQAKCGTCGAWVGRWAP